MTTTVIIAASSILVTLILATIAAAVAWGKMRKTVESHTKSIDGCKMDNLITEEDCEKIRNAYKEQMSQLAGLMRQDCENLQKDVSIKFDELKEDVRHWHDFREKTAGALGRIEGRLGILVSEVRKSGKE